MAGYAQGAGRIIKLAVKYGPQAKVAWDTAGPAIKKTAAQRAESMGHRKQALSKAATVVDGGIWPLQHHDQRVYVVVADGRPIDSFPTVDVSLEELTRDADRSKILPYAEWEQKRAAARAKRAGQAVADKAPLPGRKKA